MQSFVIRFLRDGSGATAIEYTIIACGIGVAIITAVSQLGSALSAQYQAISARVQ